MRVPESRARGSPETATIVADIRVAVESRDLTALAELRDARAVGGDEDAPETCHTRADMLNRLASQVAAGVETHVLAVLPGDESILLGLSVKRAVGNEFSHERSIYQVLRIRNHLLVDIRGYSNRFEAQPTT
jgi:hypothetical protein